MNASQNGVSLGVINSVFSQNGIGLEEGLTCAARLGVNFVDLDLLEVEQRFGNASDIKAKLLAYAEEARQIADRLGLPIRSLIFRTITSADWRRRMREIYIEHGKEFVDCAKVAGAERLLYVVGEGYRDCQIVDKVGLRSFAVETCRGVAEYASEHNIIVDVELDPFLRGIVNNALSLRNFLRELDLPHVFANIDVSHFVLSDALPEDLDMFPGAGHCHLSDCDLNVHGDLPPGEGKISNWKEWMKKLEAIGVRHWALELEFAKGESDITAYVERALKGTRRLAADAGVRLIA